MSGVKTELLGTVKPRKLAYYGNTRKQEEIMQGTMPDARRRGRPRTAWMDNIKTWTGLPVVLEQSIRMTEIKGQSMHMVWSTCGSRTDKEQS